jgi:outer membrane protein OmpA-like peptidoglycan-associated protein
VTLLLHLMRRNILRLLATSVLVFVTNAPGAAQTLPQAPPQDLLWQSQDLLLQSMELSFSTTDLQFHVEDVKGAAQALAVKETQTEVKIALAGDVLFDFDKADIRPVAEPTLQQVVGIVKQYPRAGVSIDGYTDAKGADAYNLRLSEKRAAAVKSWLVQKGGMDEKRIKTKGWGKANPVASNTNPDGSDNPEGRQKNRRVEITVKK